MRLNQCAHEVKGVEEWEERGVFIVLIAFYVTQSRQSARSKNNFVSIRYATSAPIHKG